MHGINVVAQPFMELRIGCSGFYYPEWKNIFYPHDLPQRKWFEHYTKHFNTVELNGTFYRFPRVASLQQWYNNSPQQFTFCVKAPRLITHYKKFKDAGQQLLSFYDTVNEGLREKTGGILFQFPSSLVYHEETLMRIVSMLDASFVNILEFRHASWWNNTVYDTLRAAKVTFCSMSHPSLPDHVIQTADTLYYRFHGVPVLYVSPYGSEQLQHVAQQIATQQGEVTYVYFNNTAHGAAITNAKTMETLMPATV